MLQSLFDLPLVVLMHVFELLLPPLDLRLPSNLLLPIPRLLSQLVEEGLDSLFMKFRRELPLFEL